MLSLLDTMGIPQQPELSPRNQPFATPASSPLPFSRDIHYIYIAPVENGEGEGLCARSQQTTPLSPVLLRVSQPLEAEITPVSICYLGHGRLSVPLACTNHTTASQCRDSVRVVE